MTLATRSTIQLSPHSSPLSFFRRKQATRTESARWSNRNMCSTTHYFCQATARKKAHNQQESSNTMLLQWGAVNIDFQKKSPQSRSQLLIGGDFLPPGFFSRPEPVDSAIRESPTKATFVSRLKLLFVEFCPSSSIVQPLLHAQTFADLVTNASSILALTSIATADTFAKAFAPHRDPHTQNDLTRQRREA